MNGAGEENETPQRSTTDDAMSSEPLKLDEMDMSERDERGPRKRVGNDGIIALKMQNDAFKPFKSTKAQSFKQIVFDYETAGGNFLKLRAWVSEEQSRHQHGSAKRQEKHQSQK